jgi:hypothetical protein
MLNQLTLFLHSLLLDLLLFLPHFLLLLLYLLNLLVFGRDVRLDLRKLGFQLFKFSLLHVKVFFFFLHDLAFLLFFICDLFKFMFKGSFVFIKLGIYLFQLKISLSDVTFDFLQLSILLLEACSVHPFEIDI